MSWNCIFHGFKLFPSSKIEFGQFWNCQKWNLIKKKLWNWFIWFHEFFLYWTFSNFLAYCGLVRKHLNMKTENASHQLKSFTDVKYHNKPFKLCISSSNVYFFTWNQLEIFKFWNSVSSCHIKSKSITRIKCLTVKSPIFSGFHLKWCILVTKTMKGQKRLVSLRTKKVNGGFLEVLKM